MRHLASTGQAALAGGIRDFGHVFEFAKMLELEALSPSAGIGQLYDENQLDLLGRMSTLLSHYGDIQNDIRLPDLLAVFNLPYFTRGWIIQEIAIPTKVHFQCGDRVVSEDIFTAAISFFYIQLQVFTMNRGQRLSVMARDGKIPKLTDQERLIMGRIEPLVPSLSIRRVYQDESTRHTLDMLSLQRRFSRGTVQFREPKDRIFGFGGLASDADALGILDERLHMKDCAEVFTHVTRNLCLAGQPAILESVQWPKSKSIKDLPSWVPDYSQPSLPGLHSTAKGLDPDRQDAQYSAGGPDMISACDITSQWQFREGENSLSLPVLIVDKIQEVGSTWIGDFDVLKPAQICEEIDNFCRRLPIAPEQPNPGLRSLSEHARPEAWRITTFDREPIGHFGTKQRATTRTLDSFKDTMELLSWIKLVQQGREHDIPLTEEQKSALAQLPARERESAAKGMRASRLVLTSEVSAFIGRLHALEGKRSFVARSGLVGIAQGVVQPGDMVCVTRGLRVPFIITEESVAEGVSSHYSFKGEAYCHGIMDGEAWDADGLDTLAVTLK